MPDPGQLPPEVYQALGWSPAADPTNAPPVPMPPDAPPDWGGLPLSVPQGMGWAPPPDAAPPAPQLSPPPASLPSMGAPPAPAADQRSATPDYQVPPSAFGGAPVPGKSGQPPPAAPRAAPARPQTFDQRVTGLEQREADTLGQQQRAIDAGVQAEKGRNADDLAAYQRMDQQVAANAAARKAESEQWAKIYATNEAKTDADRKQIESWKFNRNKYMDDLGVGGKVSWGIGAILAGVGNALMGNKGANPVIEMLQQNIHDANEQQMKERDHLVQKLGMDRQTGLDAQAYHATRQAEIDKQDGLAYTALSKQIEEAAIKSADPMAQARGMKEAADLRAKSDELLKGSIQLRSQHDLQAQQNAIAGGHLALDTKKFTWEKDKEQQQLDINAAKLLTTKQGKLDEEQAKRALYIPAPDGSGQLVVARRQDGTPVLAGSAEIASKDQNMVGAAASYNRLIGQMVRGIKDHGGESDYVKSKDWQNMQSDLESAVAELHDAYGITSFREPTMKFFEKMATAGVDPTSFVRDASAALERSNQNLQAKVNERIQARGYDGPQFGWRDSSTPTAPTRTDEDKLFKVAAGSRSNDPGAVYNPKTGSYDPKVSGYYSIDPDAPSTVPAAGVEDKRIAREYPRMGPGQKAALDTFAAMARSNDPELQKRGFQHLEELARPGTADKPILANEDGVRSYAQELLNRAAMPEEQNPPGNVRIDAPTAPPVAVPPALRLQR